jgi:hypothetical protein
VAKFACVVNLVAAVAACAARTLVWPSPVPLRASIAGAAVSVPPLPAPDYRDVTCTKDLADLERLVQLADEVARQAEFQEAVESLPTLDTGRPPSPAGSSASIEASDATHVYLGLAAGTRLSPRYTVAGNAWFKNETGVTSICDGEACTKLREIVLTRFRQGEPEGIACAINTVLHERTHAILLRAGSAESLFQDKLHGDAGPPLVSYSFGAVAQCVYLQAKFANLPLARCISAVGTRGFSKESCDVGWANALIAASGAPQ